MAAGGEDPFAEYLAQDAAPAMNAYAAPAMDAYSGHIAAAPPPAGGEVDASVQLRLLVESSQRQEQLLGKVCSLLVSLDEKMGRLAANQSMLESRLDAVAGGGYAAAGAPVGKVASGSNIPRGSLIAPPGQPGAVRQPPAPAPSASFTNAQTTAAQRAEFERQEAERLAAERIRIEEEARRRAEELARKREEDERRRREEAERQRLEEERRREEERQRKAALENKTNAAMSSLLTGGGGGGLFGDDDTAPKKKKGGLFDDDD
eukprot:TRINITY_DN91960_c0_g1_i1.p1 TRINITY_DN91960_c0_g1~~TRINITY_DN91960_c0_g1_i1.p1  ORF type:complete len:262 (+),score=81.69 TRINITY_DN91960_c0_g1_i1:110-895(+)